MSKKEFPTVKNTSAMGCNSINRKKKTKGNLQMVSNNLQMESN